LRVESKTRSAASILAWVCLVGAISLNRQLSATWIRLSDSHGIPGRYNKTLRRCDT
jgi:hypothetical protein